MKKYIPFFGIFFITTLIFFTNYKPGTILSGWDNLQTELAPVLAIKRAFFAVWEEYQSFGLISGMAHAADLVRALMLAFLQFFIPFTLIRYFFHCLMLAVGGIGMFNLLQFVFSSDKETAEVTKSSDIEKNSHASNIYRSFETLIAFSGSLFYMLNYGTIQLFFLPFEAFSTFFGFLPWLIWIFLKCVSQEKNHKLHSKWLIVFTAINLFATPAFYVQTLFIVYMLSLSCIAIWCILSKSIIYSDIHKVLTSGTTHRFKSIFSIQNFFSSAKKVFVLYIIIFSVNAFWILPQFYFLATSKHTVKESKINISSTQEVYFLNREMGTLPHFMKFEGMYSNLFDMRYKPLFAPWKKHFSGAGSALAYIPFGFIFLGIFAQFRYKKTFIGLFLLCMLALLTNTPLFKECNEIIRSFPLINQIFRNPFTKFIVPYALVGSIFFTAGLKSLSAIYAISNNKNYLKFFGAAVIIFLAVYSMPAFKGYFFSPEMRITIPKDYFDVMNYFANTDKNVRISLLPEYTFWGWFFHRWDVKEKNSFTGYNGSGFLWYGIEQPIVSRTFDTWSRESERYYWEIKSAIEAENLGLFEAVLEKFDINYLIVDYSLLPVSASLKGLQYERINALLEKSNRIIPIIKGKHISLFKFKDNKTKTHFISASPQLLPNIGPQIEVTNDDYSYAKFNNYKTEVNKTYDIFFPFHDLFSQTPSTKKHWDLEERFERFIFRTKLPFSYDQYDFISQGEPKEVNVFKNDAIATYSSSLETFIEGKNTFRVDVIKDKITDFLPRNTTVYKNCYYRKGGSTITKYYTSLSVRSENGNIPCFSYSAKFLPQRFGYLLRIESRNLTGQRFFFYTLDTTKRQAFIEDRLQNEINFYFLPPKYQYGLGYIFSFHNNSYENIPSENTLEALDVYLMPYNELKEMYFIKKGFMTRPKTYYSNVSAHKHHYFLYSAKLPDNFNGTLLLSQAFHTGWKGYYLQIDNDKNSIFNIIKTYLPFFFGKEIKNHVRVNGWQNGWEIQNNQTAYNNYRLSDNSTIVLIFWPQYLEFIGFGLLIGLIVYIEKLYFWEKKE